MLLLEVALPLPGRSKKWAAVEKDLLRAEEEFRNGNYHSCVSSCRTVIQELGHKRFSNKSWAEPLLTRLSSERKEMSKNEREGAIWGAVRHYTHQAHHSDSEGGISEYSRAEAQLILTLTSAFVAHAGIA